MEVAARRQCSGIYSFFWKLLVTLQRYDTHDEELSCRFFQPVSEEQHAGEDFGYVVAFSALGSATWMQAAVASSDASRYVYRNQSVAPLSPFEVKVGVYNSRGEGPFSRVVRVFSAENGEQKNTGVKNLFLLYLDSCLCSRYKLNTSNSPPRYVECYGKNSYIKFIQEIYKTCLFYKVD